MKTQSKTKPAKSTKKPAEKSLKKFQLTEGMNILTQYVRDNQ